MILSLREIIIIFRQNDKVIINSHVSRGVVLGSNFDHDVWLNNFGILTVELKLVDGK